MRAAPSMFNVTFQLFFLHRATDCSRNSDIKNLLCHEDDVVQLLSSLDINKASGPDNISARMLKATAHSIAPSVTKLFNICIRNGTLPSMWKMHLRGTDP